MTLNISLRGKLVLAVISAIGVALTLNFENEIEKLFMGNLLFYALSGLFFAAGVLYPYIRQDRLIHLRAAALIITSVLSYFLAVRVATVGIASAVPAVPGIPGVSLASFIAASVVGVAIVMVALSAIAPIKFSLKYLALGTVAGIAGGVVTYLTLMTDELLILICGYACWHTLVCIAIYYGSTLSRDRYQAIP